jgi:hypothetical protein
VGLDREGERGEKRTTMWVSIKLETVLKIPSAPLGCSSHQRGKHSEKSLKLDNQRNVCEYREGKKESKHGRPLVCSTLNSKLESGIKLGPSLTRWWADVRCHVGNVERCQARDSNRSHTSTNLHMTLSGKDLT